MQSDEVHAPRVCASVCLQILGHVVQTRTIGLLVRFARLRSPIDLGHSCRHLRLAELILSYENDALTQNVVIGMELVNEPDHAKWTEVQALYTEMVPELRSMLPTTYSLYLSFMTDLNAAATWMKQQVLESFTGVRCSVMVPELCNLHSRRWRPCKAPGR